MDIRSKLISVLFRDSCYFTNLSEYIKTRVNEEKLSYKDLKYLYKNLHFAHSLFVRQNIYPVGEFLSKGFTTNEAEKIAKLLPDAKKYSEFCYSDKEIGYKYNKLFRDLRYSYTKYEMFYNRYNSKDKAFEKLENVIKNTTVRERSDEVEKMTEKENAKLLENIEEMEME